MNIVNHRINPYIIGRPIYERSKFFGRESLFHFIEDNLSQGVKVILLHGQRRIGKSSVLRQVSNFIRSNEFIFVQFDLQDKIQSSLSNIIHDLATEIIEQLGIDRDNLQIPTNAQLEEDINLFSEIFLPKVYEAIRSKKLVLLLDEFDVANIEIKEINIVEQQTLFPYLKKILKEQDKLFIIPVIGRYLKDLPNLLSLFKDAPSELIGLLDDTSAKRMIVNPAEGILIYEAEAIKKILQLSARHPCFTQVICFALFEQARENNKWSIECADVECILKKAIETADSFLQSFWQVLTVEEKIIMSTVAEAQKIAVEQGRKVPEEPLDLLKRNGINQTDKLSESWERLIENHYLSDDGRKLRVELIRCWLLQYHPLQYEIQSFQTQESQTNLQTQENQEDIVNNLIGVAKYWCQQGQHQLALQLYEQALAINPNNFNIAVSLAEQYLQVQDYSKSLELHKQLFQENAQSSKAGYLDALSEYGHYLIIQRQYTLAKEQYNQILEIEPNRKLARHKILEIESYENNLIITKPDTSNSLTNPRERNHISSTLRKILAGMTVLVLGSVGYGAYLLASDCPPGKQKKLGVLCIEDKNRISNGDRTFFPNIKNIARGQGIQAFKKQDYKEAIKLFQKAVAASRNDPEVLIYYNNALARDKGNPITLAVAVPADNNTNFAQEILRGVSQAQYQFNNGKNGLNGRLLEIKIANDAGQLEQAKEVATELVKDSSILGVIGHHSSESTKAALQEYKKTDIAIISPSSTSTQLQGNNFFRSLPSDTAGGKKLAEYAFKNLNLRKVVIFSNPDSSYSNSMREEFRNKFEQLGGKVLRKPQINLADTSLDMSVEVYKSIYTPEYKAEAAILIPDALSTDAALKVATANQEEVDKSQSQNGAKVGMKLLAGDILYSDKTLSQGRNAVEGLITVVPWFREAPQAKIFAQKAEKQWGGGVSWRTATSYDATQAFIQALSVNSDRKTVINKLRIVNISQDNTSGDPLQFNSEGERQTEPILVQIQSGKWVMLQPN